ncbi:MAG TPA: alpha/beta hydrolase [Jatrophihabitans sp.]|nr:alpha/beta hydrolase [Jatrophihabitans sp.]
MSEVNVGDGVVSIEGRDVGFRLHGPSTGTPVVLHTGTPGTSMLSPQQVSAAERAGVRLLVIDRPGYGASTRQPGRRVVDVVANVARIADDLGWDRFAVWGGSGGAPHALACAAALPHRVTKCASVVGPAPFDASGLDWWAGMSPGNVEEFRLAQRGESAYRPLVAKLAADAVSAAAAGDIQVGEQYQLADSDIAALKARTSEDGYLARVQASFQDGMDGWIDDGIAMVQPWGFDLATISVPVSVRYGLDDVLVPSSHGDYLARVIPDAHQALLSGGHILSDDDLDSIYAWLTS